MSDTLIEPSAVDQSEPIETVLHAEALAKFDEAVSPVIARLSSPMVSATHGDLAVSLAAVRQGVANALGYLIHGPEKFEPAPADEMTDAPEVQADLAPHPPLAADPEA